MTLKWELDAAGWVDAGLSMASLANGSIATGTTVITNGTNLALRADLSVVLGSITPGTGGFIEAHLVPLLRDGTNYADVAISGATMFASLPLTSGASIKRIGFMTPRSFVEIPPGSFKIAIGNRAGVAFAASGNEVYYRLYRLG